jgi:hypothetical protein
MSASPICLLTQFTVSKNDLAALETQVDTAITPGGSSTHNLLRLPRKSQSLLRGEPTPHADFIPLVLYPDTRHRFVLVVYPINRESHLGRGYAVDSVFPILPLLELADIAPGD